MKWVKDKDSIYCDNFYRVFESTFNSEYRSELYNTIYNYFNDNEIVSNELLIFWKLLVIDLIRNNKKYNSNISTIYVDLKNQSTNFVLVKEKAVFRCYVDEEPLCFFKENGNNYYVS